nr:hypothetical protein [Tanacetum cinerariifolium]
MPSKPDLSFYGLEEFVYEHIVSEPTVKKHVVKTSEAKASTDKPKVVRKNFSSPHIKDWISDSEDGAQSKPKIEKKTIKPSFAKIEFVKSKEQVNLLGKLLLNKYALTVNPRVYTSYSEQFWATVKAKTVTGEVQIQALLDGNKVIITESTVRKNLQLEDVEGVDCLPNASIFEQLTLMRKPRRKVTKVPQPNDRLEHVADEAVYKEMDDRLVRAATTASGLEAKQGIGNINKTQSKATPNESSSQGTDSGGGPRVLNLETTKTTQAMKIESLKRRVKKLKKKQRSRTYSLKRLYKVGLTAGVDSSDEASLGEDASKQEMIIDDIDADEGITLIDETTKNQGTFNDQEDAKMLFDVANDLRGEEDKGKAIMIEEPVKLKKKDQIMLDEEVALKLQAELQAKFNKEQRLASEKAQQEEEVNSALIEE